tara:strand:+ start:45 stop:1073 length:1029 start_codon:yes stop_codon:yes gene_type:complete
MAQLAQNFNSWIRQHKLFALALPIVVLLLVYFISNSIQGMTSPPDSSIENNGYNNSLPNQSNELEIKDPNTYFKESVNDSLDKLRDKGKIKNIVGREKEKDSLEQILEDLENFSIDENKVAEVSPKNREIDVTTNNSITNRSNQTNEVSEYEQKLEYRNMLLEAREKRKAKSQDYSAPKSKNNQLSTSLSNLKVSAAIYKDQFILPGKLVTLILKEELTFNGKSFPKNTFVYAKANIRQSRVLLEIDNVDDFPINLEVKARNGGVGIYNPQAGELLSEFYSDVEEGTVQDISLEVSRQIDNPMSDNTISAFNKYFKRKKRKNKDEILLRNGHPVFLTLKKDR